MLFGSLPNSTKRKLKKTFQIVEHSSDEINSQKEGNSTPYQLSNFQQNQGKFVYRTKLLKNNHWQLLGEGILAKPLNQKEEILKALETRQGPSFSINRFTELQKAKSIGKNSKSGLMDAKNPKQNIGGEADSPSASHYGEFYCLIESNERARLGRTQEDLHKCKERIDANVIQQKEYSDIIAEMQNKLQEYRRHIRELEQKIENRLSAANETTDTSLLPFHDSGFVGDSGNLWTPHRRGISDYDITVHLEDEKRRNDEIRNQLEYERTHNEQLRQKIEQIIRDYERELREKEYHYQNRERNLSQSLNDEQRKMLDVWTEMQNVRKQFIELKNKTQDDLENQKNEFTRIFRSIHGVSKIISPEKADLGGVNNGEILILIEEIRRLRKQESNDPKLTDDSELNQELIKKYEQAIERNIELESSSDVNNRKIAELEAELKRTKEKLNDCQNAIRKLYDISNENGSDRSDNKQRSISPNTRSIQPSEAIRCIRNVFREKNNIIEQLHNNLKTQEDQARELLAKFDIAEEQRYSLEKELSDAKRKLIINHQDIDDKDRCIRRLEDKIKNIEHEKNVLESSKKKMELELQRIREQYEKAATDESRKVQDKANEFTANMEQDYKNRTEELNQRITLLQNEKVEFKNELSSIKTKYRELESQYHALQHELEDKENHIQTLDEQKKQLLIDYETQKQQIELLTTERNAITSDKEHLRKQNKVFEQNIKELKQQRDKLSAQKDEILKQLAETTNQLKTKETEQNTIQKTLDLANNEITKLKTQITNYEEQIIVTRRQNDDLDTQLQGGQAKIVALENEIKTNKKEIENLNELNERLQREKQETLKSKHETEEETLRLNEQIRKHDQDIKKLHNENKLLDDTLLKTKEEFNEQIQKNNLLESELHDAQVKIKLFEEQIQRNKPKDKPKRSVKGDKDLITDKDGTDGHGIAEEDTEIIDEEFIKEHDPEIIEITIKKNNEEWKWKIDKLETEKDQLESRIHELEDQLLQAERINERHQNDAEENKRKLKNEIDQLKDEILKIHDKQQIDLDEERNDHKKNLDAQKLKEEELAEKIKVLEKRLADTLNCQNEYERIKRESEEKINALNIQNQKIKADLEDLRIESEKEIQKWKSDTFAAHSDLKSHETTISGLKRQLNTINDRNDTLNKTVNDYVSKIRDLTTQVRKLQDELTEIKSSSAAKDIELDTANAQLNQLELNHHQLQKDFKRIQTEFENLKKENDEIKRQNTSLDIEMIKLKKQLQENDAIMKEMKNALSHITNNKEQLQIICREKSKQTDHNEKIIQQLEEKNLQLKKELQEISDKLITDENERIALKNDIVRHQQELEFIREQMLRKTEEYQNTIDELINSHRISEDGRLNAIQELATKKYEFNDMESQLDKAEQRMASLQQEFIIADSERDSLQDVLRRFQNTVSRVITMNQFKNAIDANRKEKDSGEILDENILRLLPLQPDKDGFSIASIDTTLQLLSNKIEQLSRERNQLMEELTNIKRKANEANSTINKHEDHYKTIEENLFDLEEEKRLLEARLTAAKELLRTQEETTKQRDEERRQLKTKIITIELENRGKEAQIRHLNEQLKNLRTDLDKAHEELRSVHDTDETLEMQRYQMESKLRDKENELQRLQLQLNNSENAKQTLLEKTRELTRQLKYSDTKNADISDDISRLKRELQKAQELENELHRNIEQQNKENTELRISNDQLIHIQNDSINNNIKKLELETELSTTRTEIRDQKQRIHDLNNKIQDLQRNIQDLQASKNRSEDRANNLDKTIATQHTIETNLRQQNEVLKNEKKSLIKDFDEIKDQLKQIEIDKASLNQNYEQWKKEKRELLKKIQLLETEKRKTDEAIRETALQRQAIEKSLNAMERENKELYKNCSQLQQQIMQLEIENGNRILNMTKLQREEQEKQIQRIRNEKAQIEKTIENRERVYKDKIKQLESQILTLRDQVEMERRRNREVRDRKFADDVIKLGFRNNYFNRTGGGIIPTSFHPENIDTVGHRFVHTTFASNPLTPPRKDSTLITTHNNIEETYPSLAPKKELDQESINQLNVEQKQDESVDLLKPYKELD